MLLGRCEGRLGIDWKRLGCWREGKGRSLRIQGSCFVGGVIGKGEVGSRSTRGAKSALEVGFASFC